MALHPGEHFVHRGDLPVAVRMPAIRQQRVGLVEDQKRLRRAGLVERGGDLLLGLSDVGRQKVGSTLLDYRHAEPVGEIAHVGALARTRRTFQAQRDAARPAGDDLFREFGRVGVGTDQDGVVSFRRLLLARSGSVGEHAQQAVHALPDGFDVASREHRAAYRSFRHTRRHGKLLGQLGGGAGFRHPVPVELAFPDRRSHRSRRQPQLQGVHHAAQDHRIDRPDVVHDPDRRHRCLLQQAVQEHLRSLAAPRPGGKQR